MNLSRNKMVWVLIIAALVSCLLPWCRFNIFGTAGSVAGINVWQGKVVVGVCIALGLYLLVRPSTPVEQARYVMAAGAAIAVVAALYTVQIVLPSQPQIDVREGGEMARGLAQNLVSSMNVRSSIGAPAAVLLGLGLLYVGRSMARGATASDAPPPPQP